MDIYVNGVLRADIQLESGGQLSMESSHTASSSVTLAMNALSLVIYWVGAALVNNVPAADTSLRLTAFSDIVVFGTYATYVIMSIMLLVMVRCSVARNSSMSPLAASEARKGKDATPAA